MHEETDMLFSFVSCLIRFANVVRREREGKGGIKEGMMQLANTKEKEKKEEIKDINTVRLRGTCLKVGNQLAQDTDKKIDKEESRISA